MVYKDVKWNPDKGTTSSTNSRASAAMVEEDLWDLAPKWKSLAANATTKVRPDATQLDKPTKSSQQATPITATPIQERLAGDKSIASFKNAFGRDLDSEDGRENDKALAAAAATPEDLTGTQFIFSTDQIERENERALQGSESDGKSMSTAGKTTGTTRLKLKEAQEELAELRLASQAQNEELKKALAAMEEKAMHDQMESPPPPPAVRYQKIVDRPELAPSRAADLMDTNEEPSDIQLMRAAILGPKEETLEQESDAMEEDQHSTFHLGTYPGLPPLPYSSPEPSSESSSSSSSSSSSASEISHDTQELAHKLRSNPFNVLRKHTTPKILIKIDETNGSKSDSNSHQSSGQESGSSTGHLQEASSGNASAVPHDAGHGD
jgi:hypothetical protein